jgi:hypothetical protein
MRRFGLAAFLVLALVVGAVGVVAYNLGVTAGATDAAIAAGASVIYAPAAFSPFGIIIGLFFLILFLGFASKLIFGPRRHMGPAGWGGPGGPGGWGRHRGDWDHETVPEPFRPMLERWHQDAHGEAGDDPKDGSHTDSPEVPPSGPTPGPRPPRSATGPSSRPTA